MSMVSPMSNSPRPARLFLLRHGEVEPAWRDRLYGAHDIELSPRGCVEAREAAERLRNEVLDGVVSSGLRRTEYGAALLRAERAVPRRDEPDLRELSRGAWVGLTFREVPAGGFEAWLAEPEHRRPPGGESLADLAQRVLPRLDALSREFADQNLALVVHSWVIRVAVCAALGMSLRRAPQLAVTTGSVTVLDWTADGNDAGARHVVVAGFATDRAPVPGTGWYRGPARR